MNPVIHGRTLLVLAALGIMGSTTGQAASLPRSLAGNAPPADSLAATVPIDTLSVRRLADGGSVTLLELLNHGVGFDNGRTGVEGVFRSLDFGSTGPGRTPVRLDGLPGGARVIHWDNLSWIPVRALKSLEFFRGVDGPDPGGAGGLVLETFRPVMRPTSTVTMTGGSYGHRLAELDFSRRFGRTEVHADVANLTHDGFGAFSDVENSRGFLRMDFPLAGWGLSMDAALESGRLTYLESFIPEGDEKTGEKRLSLKVLRPGGTMTGSFLHHKSRLEAMDTADPFELSTSGTRIGLDSAPRRSSWTWGVSVSRENRSGVLEEPRDFLGAEGRVHLQDFAAGPFRGAAGLVAGYREPTGWILDPSVSLRRRLGATGRYGLSAGRVSTIPGILFHEGSSRPDRDALARILTGLESLESPETHWTAGASAEAGSRLRAGVHAGMVRTTHRPLLLRPTAELIPFQVEQDPEWSGQVDAALAWRPSSGFSIDAWAGWHGFDPMDHPYSARLRGEGQVTLRRRYFENDLDLSASGFVRVVGSRVNTIGDSYPALVTGGFSLTGVIRALTLFYRVENAGGIVVESDFLNGETPVYLPGLHNRIGATLHLVD